MRRPISLLVAILFVVVAAPLQSQIMEATREEAAPITGMVPVPGSHLLQAQNEALLVYLADHPDALHRSPLLKPSWSFFVGSTYTWKAQTFDTYTFYNVPSTCRAVGTHCYVFVEDAVWGSRVTQVAVDSIRNSFDDQTPANPSKGVYEMVTELFGSPPDVDGDPKIVILILDIKDTFSGTGVYVGGYFGNVNEVPGAPNSNGAEIYYVDANPLDLTQGWGIHAAMHTATHEFQHMIHWGKDFGEQIFFNEGCSCFGESYCGYGIYHPDHYVHETNRSLLDWRAIGDQDLPSDYSRAARFFQYVADQIGAGVFAPLVASPLHGIAGLDAALAGAGADRNFSQIFPDWLVANILDNRTVDPRFGYVYPDLPKALGDNFPVPNVPLTQHTVAPLAARYYSFVGGSDLHITFLTESPDLLIKAVEEGAPSRVLDVTPGVEFHEPGFGSTYSKIHFIVINASRSTPAAYSFSSTGTGASSLELKYDPSEPTGRYLALQSGDTAAVWFEGVPGARLDSIRVAMSPTGSMTGGIFRYTGEVQPTPLGVRLAPNFVATRTGSPSWATVDLGAHSIDASMDFAVAFVCAENAPRVQVVYSPYASVTDFHSYTYYLEAPQANWYVLQRDEDTAYAYSIRAYVSFGATDVTGEPERFPLATSLEQNYPNPFNPGTEIRSQMSEARHVKLAVYDLLGREVVVLVDERRGPGKYRDFFDGSGLASGLYVCRLTAGSFVQSKTMLLLK